MITHSLAIRRSIFVYEAARLAVISAKCPIVPKPWLERNTEFQEQFVTTVNDICTVNIVKTAEELHSDWVIAYEKMGWVYGPVRSTEHKTHPDMVPYNELPTLERDKDDVFVGLCLIARQWIRE